MELTLNQAAIDCYDKVFSQTVRKEESQDSVVPDTLPDIGEILCTSGNVLIRSKDVGEGRVRIEANIPVKVAYAPEEGEGTYCLEVNIPLYVSMEDDAIPEKCLCVAELRLAGLETRILNPRKISVRAETLFSVGCYAAGQIAFAGAPEQAGEDVNVLEQTVTVTPACAVTEKTFVLTDEFTIPDAMPPAAVILSRQTLLQAEDVKAVGTKLIVKGSARSSLLYVSDEMRAGAVEFSTGFSQIIEVKTMPEDPFASVSLLLSGAYYDLSRGDGRTGEMELHVVAQAVVCGNAEAVCLADAYSNRCALEMTMDAVDISRIRRPLVLRETLRGQLNTAKPVAEILQGCFDLGAVRAEGNAVTLPVTVCMHYRTPDGSLCSAKQTFQVKFSCPLEDGEYLEPVGVSAQELYLAPSAGGAELRLPLELQVFVRETETVESVTAITYDESSPLDLSDQPTLVILRAGSGDDLWALAKQNHSTVRAITEANDLDAQGGGWEKLILIPKMV